MPFDSFMTSALCKELESKLIGAKVDKISQPERDEVDLIFRFGNRNRLVINCTASTPYMALSNQSRENPPVPPMMCMLLRKHLSRAKITAVEQLDFDRIIHICFDSGDEMGFRRAKHLYCEMMGRGSNLIFTDENDVILAAFRQNDITTKFDRIIMVGVPYTPMPPQDKINPLHCTKDDFLRVFETQSKESRADMVLQKNFSGFGKLTAREIVFRAGGDAELPIKDLDVETLWLCFSECISHIIEGCFSPCLVYENRDAFLNGESPIDFSFMEIRQFSAPFYVHPCSGASEAIEQFYIQRNQSERHKQHYNDIAQILKNCRNRLEKKISAQEAQLEEAKDAEQFRLFGDLIMQEMYRIRRGESEISVINYETGEEVKISLDTKKTPSQNAQSYYREYNKKKTAMIKVAEQIEIAKAEIEYCNSVFASLENAVSSDDLSQIREELSHWSYGRRLTSSLKKPQKKIARAKPMQGKTKNGFTLFIGLNNYQNDTISTQLAEKDDYWFHVKGYHGSHVLLKAKQENEIPNEDLEEAASYAAYYSEARGAEKIEVDYTKGRFLKKPNGSKPGFVTYKNHNSAFVKPQKFK